MKKYRRLLILILTLTVLIVGSVTTKTYAAGNNSSIFIQSFNATPSVVTGMVVALNPKDTTTVLPLTSQTINNMLGVVVPLNDSTIVLTPQTATASQILVANSGHYELLVSNQNGSIEKGDYITMSSLPGIGMKADTSKPKIIGKATSNFGKGSDSLETVTLKNNNGSTTDVSVGLISADVYLGSNPFYQNNLSSIPGFLSRVADTITNKPISPVRIYLSTFVLLMALLITGIILYSTVRNSIVAFGRNPLARKNIIIGMVQTTTIALIILIAGVFAVYLILNLQL